MIYVFHGDDDFSASEAARALIEAVGPGDLREANVAQLDANGFTVERFGSAAMVVPFLADRRLVMVRGLLASVASQRTARRGRRGGDGDSGTLVTALSTLLGELPPTTDVVFFDGRLTAANPLLAAIKELGPDAAVVREFPTLRRDALAAWVRERAARKGRGDRIVGRDRPRGAGGAEPMGDGRRDRKARDLLRRPADHVRGRASASVGRRASSACSSSLTPSWLSVQAPR